MLIVDSNGPRNLWTRGKIIKLYTDKERKTRVVDVTNKYVFQRPVSKWCVFDVKEINLPNCFWMEIVVGEVVGF